MMNNHESISTHISRSHTTNTILAITLASIGLLVLAGCAGRNLESGTPDNGPTAETSDEGVALIIEDRAITIGEVDEHMKEQFLEELLRQPEERQFEMRGIAIRDLVQDHVVENEARKRGITSEELIGEIIDAVPETTIENVADWYSKNQVRIGDAKLEDISSMIKDQIIKERRAKAWNDFLDPKLEALSWEMVLAPPRKELEATRLVRGSANAPVTIMTFSDYQCPYCSRAESLLTEVLERYPDQVRLIHRHFPLDNVHPFARPASEAAMCADEQGKFWEYHDGIFARQGKLEDGSFAEIGSAVGLDVDKLNTCIQERRYRDFVEADFAAGREAGVTGTPSYFLNGIRVNGARDADQMSREVDLELARIQKN